MRLVFFGTPQFAVPSLERLLAHPEFEVLAVVTQPDKRRGRGNDLSPSPVKTIALAHQIPVWQPRRVKKEEEALEQLRSSQADAFVVVAYGQILSQEILDMPRLGCINAHGSLLPKYRGAAPIQWSLYHGETETGITTMLMDAGMDTGAMLLKATTPIALLDNALDVAKTLSTQAADLLVETLLGLEQGTIDAIPQDNEQATYAPLIQKSDYQLDWTRSALALHNQIRGFYPNCVTTLRNTPLKITATVPLEGANLSSTATLQSIQQAWDATDITAAAPGTIVALLKGHGAVVQTGQGALLLQEAQLAGKRSQQGWDFVNGTRLQIGETLGHG
ncbi:methionyl-tRNA formyltransferase [Thermocoleostomius sinensis]|uniref:Methionyl-tRNA formyltransferase n=1 Tax=Thermocoleostomius sinensis A174 TaxID=2016057 RepID=A0A9E8ZC83_9CYAN|nr:methionyl-tRNA formyltransferase [Thermocoleostomius sinensis]WAL58733.1 methionyl-tRNA formyltransferase [Thermocoleostomius sinensis A174]